MHHLSFSVKRIHLRTIELLKPLAKLFGLTPARFDMLYALWGRSKKYVHTTQRDLQSILDVCAATVSRMAQSLEDLGLITREEFALDRRKVLVRFTPEGLARFESAYRELVEADIGEDPPSTQPTAAYIIDNYVIEAPAPLHARLFFALDEALRLARRGVQDRARLRFPWYEDH
jgi:DNA-binding MarR family transcriptional regulator